MPYGHNRQYIELTEEVQRKRISITRKQKQQIAKLYRDAAKEFGHKAAREKDKTTLTYRWVKDYGISLKAQSMEIYQELQKIVKRGIYDTAAAVTDAEARFWGDMYPQLSERFRDTMSTIPQYCVDELMSGGIYKDFTGLSERLWNYKKKFDTDIGYVINKGIIEQKSAYDLCKDLEIYLQPEKRKDFEWRKVYPNSNKKVDYSAQRLARTSITHAYQMSFQRATIDNPFVERYEWQASNDSSRTCDLCRQRHGKQFDKYKVPLDHPNGMCVLLPVITRSYDEIAEELNDWAHGGNNPGLDKWLDRQVQPLPRLSYMRKDYKFRKSEEMRKARVYQHNSGTHFIYPDKYDKSAQVIPIEKALKVFDDVPYELVRNIERVEFVDYQNPDDAYWEQEYGIKGFASYATGGNGRITFYENSGEPNTRQQILETYLHEGGHIWDNRYKEQYGYKFSGSNSYLEGMEKDKKLTGEDYSSEYSEEADSVSEDFADFIVAYYTDEKYCETIYPGRTVAYRRALDG